MSENTKPEDPEDEEVQEDEEPTDRKVVKREGPLRAPDTFKKG